MTAAPIDRPVDRDARPLLGFTTFFRKEIQDWVRGRRGLVVALVSVAIGLLTVSIPLITMATGESPEPALSLDPTANVLFGWSGQTAGLVLVLATMGLLSIERDQGTLAWSLTKPVSRTSILLAKWSAAFLALSLVTVVLPLVVQGAVATVAYGAVPDLGIVGSFALLYLSVPALYVTLTIALGAVVSSTAGVAGIAFLLMFLPMAVAGFVPAVNEYLPTNIQAWALATAQGDAAPWTVPAAWAASIVVLVVIAKLGFDRHES
jgi:ABC-2 type transport system permease protein